MLQNQANLKVRSYTRPVQAKGYLNAGMVLCGDQKDQKEMMAQLPPFNKIRPYLALNAFNEATSEGISAGSIVLCSGNPVWITDGTDTTGIGILKHDAKEGENASLVTEGRAWMMADVSGIATELSISTNGGPWGYHHVGDESTFGNLLSGKDAYIYASTGGASLNEGMVSTSAGAGKILVGKFTGRFEFKRQFNSPMTGWAQVDFRQVEGESMALPASDRALSQDAPLNNDTFITISGDVGTGQNLFINTYLRSPNEPILPKHVKVVYDGVDYALNGDYSVFIDFNVGILETFDVVIEKTLSDGTAFTNTAQYGFDIAADAAPANLVARAV